jgi:uncharacterized protein YjbJ (UPF0337 family)
MDRIEGAAKETAGRVKDAVGGLAGDGVLQAKGKLDEALGASQQAYGRVSASASDAINRAAERAQDARGDFEDFIGQQPLLATGIALGIGLAIGLILLGASRVSSARA